MDDQGYSSELEHERWLRKQHRAQVNELSKEIDSAIRRLSGQKMSDKMVDVQLFAHLDIGQPYEVKPGVTFIPILYGRHVWVFDTYLRAGCSYGEHLHTIKEVCEVLDGQLHNATDGRVYNVGERAEFKAHELHEPGATERSDAHYRVTFFLKSEYGDTNNNQRHGQARV